MRLSLFRRHFIAAGILAALAGLSQAAATAPRPHSPKTILVVGDSLSAEYGLKRGTGWVALLEQRLKAGKLAATVINASISGDTTAGGRSRLAPLLALHQPSHVIIELGGNDALRGLSLQMTQDNLKQMTISAQEAGAHVLLIGMQVPPNYGKDDAARFAATLAAVARERKTALVPFLLAGVADGPNAIQMFQADRIHPKEEAHPIMLDNVWPELRKQLK